MFNVSGSQLNLGWPANYTGWLLQSNATGLAITNGWHTVPGSPLTNSLHVTLDPARTNVFFRLAHP